MLLRTTAILVSLLLHGFIGYALSVGRADAGELPERQSILLPPIVVPVTSSGQLSTDTASRERDIVHAAISPKTPQLPG